MALGDALFLKPYPFHKWVAHREDGIRGSGTHSDPYRANTPEEFDLVMNSLGPSTVVHLGPGLFQTRGYYDGAVSAGYGWAVKEHMWIVGSGAGVTTLQLV